MHVDFPFPAYAGIAGGLVPAVPGRPADEDKRVRRIESMEVVGNAGFGKIVLDYPTIAFVDYMQLLKIDGEWKIINKSFQATPKTPAK